MAAHLDGYRGRLAMALARANESNAEQKATAVLEAIGSDDDFAKSVFEANVLAYLAGQLFVAEVEVPKSKRSLEGPDVALRFVNQPFDEAIAHFESLEIMSRQELDSLLESERRRAFYVTRAASDTIVQHTRDEIHRALVSGENGLRDFQNTLIEEYAPRIIGPLTPEQQRERAKFVRRMRAYLENVYRTNVASAYNAGRLAMQTRPDVVAATGYWEYVTAGDERVRDEHAALHGKQWRIGDPEALSLYPPNGFNSIVPGTHVAGVFDAASKAFYSGEAVEIETRNGRRLTVTAEHAVLTTNGFLPARLLKKGDHLVEHLPTVQRFVSGSRYDVFPAPPPSHGAIDNQERPGIQDVFDAFLSHAATLVGAEGRRASLNFKGDAKAGYGNVHVVGFNGILPNSLKALSTKLFGEPLLIAEAYASRFSDKSVNPSCDGAWHAYRFGTAPQLSPMSDEEIGDKVARTAKTLRELFDGNAGEVRLDEISSVHIRPWFGHVYDLQSPNGTIVANGLVISNCRCEMITVDREDVDTGALIRDVSGIEADEGFDGPPSLEAP